MESLLKKPPMDGITSEDPEKLVSKETVTPANTSTEVVEIPSKRARM